MSFILSRRYGAARRHSLRLVAAAALLAGSATISAPPASGADTVEPGGSAHGTDDPTDVLAAEKLAEDYGLALEDARARIAQQDMLEAVAEDLQNSRLDTAAGAYIDHERGGALVVRDTEPETALDTVPAEVRALLIVEDAAYTTVELIEASETAEDALTGSTEVAPPMIDVRANQVAVPVTTSAEAAPAEEVVDDLNEPGTEPIAKTEVEPAAEYTSDCQTSAQLYDAPLRGGIGISGDYGASICTAGFNVQSNVDDKKYVLTAGHCTNEGVGTWRTEFQGGTVHQVGSTHNSSFATSAETDTGLIWVSNTSGWNPQWWVLVRQSSPGTVSTTQNERYPVTQVGYSVVGSYICKTGLVTGTQCGEIGSLNQRVSVDDNGIVGIVSNAGVADIFVCTGDSGGPLYKDNRGFGITSAGRGFLYQDNGFNTGIGFINARCFAKTVYVGMSTALSVTRTRLIGT